MANSSGENHGSNIEVLVESIRIKVHPMPSQQPYIYEVPKSLRKVKEEDEYLPQIISIGPIHRGKRRVHDLEDQKKWYLHALLTRSSTRKTCLEESVRAIKAMEDEIRKCYKEPIILTSDELVEMMLLDGYFILELFYNFKKKPPENENDPIFKTLWMIPILQIDLMLLENQLPLIVLDRLFNLSYKDPKQDSQSLSYLDSMSLNHLVIYFFYSILPIFKPIPPHPNIQGNHLLELLHNHLTSSSQTSLEIRSDNAPSLWEFTFSATDLLEAGVNFKKNEDRGLLDIKFNDGVLEIPRFFFGDVTVHLFRNLIALEQCDRTLKSKITSYVLFLDILINSRNDVRLLRHKKILECYGSYDKLANSINNVRKEIMPGPITFHYHELCSRINVYYRSDFNKWRATLMHDYFNTPWAIISFLGAIVLLVLTFLQTIYSMKS